MYMRKEFKGAAPATTLVAQLANTQTSGTFDVNDATGWPTGSVGPFVIVVSRGTAIEEKILCTSRASNTLTIQSRGYDGTSPQTHPLGGRVHHILDAATIDEVNLHANTRHFDVQPAGASVNYYINYATGSDSNAGTSSGTPFKTFTKLLTVLPYVITADTNVYFMGQYNPPTNDIVLNNRRTANCKLIFRGFNAARADRISVEPVVSDCHGGWASFASEGTEVIFKNLTIDNRIHIYNSTSIKVNDCTFSDTAGTNVWAILFYNTNGVVNTCSFGVNKYEYPVHVFTGGYIYINGCDGTANYLAYSHSGGRAHLLDNASFVSNVYPAVTATEGQVFEKNWHYVGVAGEPSWQNSWVNYGSGYDDLSFKLWGRYVEIRGLIKSGTVNGAGEVVIFTLPAPLRPALTKIFSSQAGANYPFQIYVKSGGPVTFYYNSQNNFCAVNAGYLI